LIAKVLNLDFTKEKSRCDFYRSEDFEILLNSNIGNTTCYDDVFQVLPNHYFDLSENESLRYWPKHKIKKSPLNEVVDICSVMIKGFIESICSRYPVMLPVTAGRDSRLLLAATSSVRNKVFYYINRVNGIKNKTHHDMVIPGRLLPKLNLEFHILDPGNSIDKDFEKIYFENNRFGSLQYLPIIHNYFANFSDKINLPATFSSTTQSVYETNGKAINADLLASLILVRKYDFAEKYFKAWFNECGKLCRQCNIDILNLLYWEERMANWGTQIQLDKDIAQDEIIPYNSRLLMETMLMAPESSRDKPDFELIREITKKLWPETLQEPYNIDIKTKALKLSKTLGIMQPVKSVYYSFIFPALRPFIT
jgi:hypothetical protein